MRKLTKEEKKDYEFLLQFIDTKKIEIIPQKPPKGFEDDIKRVKRIKFEK